MLEQIWVSTKRLGSTLTSSGLLRVFGLPAPSSTILDLPMSFMLWTSNATVLGIYDDRAGAMPQLLSG